jgi:hypothetical protein
MNLVVSDQGWRTSGSFKSYSKTADSGNTITTYFCPECGSSMYRVGPTFGSSKVIQAGILDDLTVMNELEMEVELFAPQRLSWVQKISGAQDKHDMQ